MINKPSAIEKPPRSGSALQRNLRIEEISTQFELSWNSNQRVEIEDCLQSHSADLVAEIVRELTAVECELRIIAGEQPQLAEYTGRFPAYGHEVREAFALANELNGDLICERDPTDTSQIPTHIGDYRIVRKIGHGGMGIVYEAIQESLDRRVAIKTLNDHPLNVPRKATRFRREARAVAKLHHNNIVNLFGSGVHNGIPYIAMQLVDGKSLDTLLKQARTSNDSDNPLLGKNRFTNIARIGSQVARALQYAHEHGILHRDIKPSNLIIDDSNKTWVSDFGLAKLTTEPEATNSIDVVGTLRYLPPEAVNGDWQPLGDVYSLGLTLYELLALNPAYPESDRIVLLRQKSSGDRLKRLTAPGSRVPVDLENIIVKATQHHAGSRYSNAGQFADDLDRFLAGKSTLARPDGPLTRIAKWSKRKKALAALLFTIILVAVTGIPSLTYLWLRSENALHQLEAEQLKTSIARKLESKALRAAKAASLEAEAARYGSSIQLAYRYHTEGNVPETQRILHEWVPQPGDGHLGTDDRRGWEWYYLHTQLDDSELTLSGNQYYVWSVGYSPDDSSIVTVHGSDPIRMRHRGCSGNCEAIVWNASTGEKLRTFQDPHSNIFDATFSPDNNLLVTLGIDFDDDNGRRGNLVVWDLQTGEAIRSLKLPGKFDRFLLVEKKHRPYLSKVRFSNDGRRLIIGPDPIEILDADSLDTLATIEHGIEFIELPDQDVVFVTRSGEHLMKWNRASGQISKHLHVDGHPQDIALCGSGSWLSLLIKSRLLVKDFTTGETRLDSRDAKIHWACIDPSGNSLFFAKPDGTLIRKYFQNPDFNSKRFGHQSSITSAAFNRNATKMVTGSFDGTAKIWNIGHYCRSPVYQSYATQVPNSRIADIEFIDDEEVAYVSHSRLPEHSPIPNCGSVGGAKAKSVKLHTTHYANWPRTDFDFAPGGGLVAGPVSEAHFPKNAIDYVQSDQIGIWSTSNWRQQQVLQVSMNEIRSIAWNSNGRLLAVAGHDDEQAVIRIYARKQDQHGRLLDTLGDYPVVELETQPVDCLAFREELLAAASRQSIQIWSLAADTNANPCTRKCGSQTQRLPVKHVLEASARIRYLDFSPDGKRLAAAMKDSGKFAVWNLDSANLIYEKPGPRDICCVKFSPNNRRLALSGYEGSVFSL